MILKIVITLPNGIAKENTDAWRCISVLPPVIAGYEVRPIASYGASIQNVRNFGVNETGCNECWQNDFNFDALLFWDYDISATAEDVERLLSSGKEIVGGLYMRRNGYQYEAGCHGPIKGLAREKLLIGQERRGLVPVDYVGAGFLLVRAEIFRRLPYPWFESQHIEWQEEGVWHAVPGNEDVGFCMLAQKNGFPIFVDTDCILKHSKGDVQMNAPQQQVTIEVLENSISRACTQIMASAQMLIDNLRNQNAQLNNLKAGVPAKPENIPVAPAVAPVAPAAPVPEGK